MGFLESESYRSELIGILMDGNMGWIYALKDDIFVYQDFYDIGKR